MSSSDLLSLFKQELPPIFKLSDAVKLIEKEYKAPEKKMIQLEKDGLLIRLKKGLYTFKESFDRYVVANSLYSPSYVSFETALSFHEMIPEKVETVYSVTSHRAIRFETTVGDFEYRSQSTELYSKGLSMFFYEEIPFQMASKEKALCDTISQCGLMAKSLTGRDIFLYAVNSLRIEPDLILNLSLSKIKKMAFDYRNHAPRKLYQYIAAEKKGVGV